MQCTHTAKKMYRPQSCMVSQKRKVILQLQDCNWCVFYDRILDLVTDNKEKVTTLSQLLCWIINILVCSHIVLLLYISPALTMLIHITTLVYTFFSELYNLQQGCSCCIRLLLIYCPAFLELLL